MKIYLKNGCVVETSDEFTRLRRDANEKIISMTWSHKPGQSLYYLDPSEVVCILDDSKEIDEAADAKSV